jgi:hypothetical protein
MQYDAANETLMPGLWVVYAGHHGHDSYYRMGRVVEILTDGVLAWLVDMRYPKSKPHRLSHITRMHRLLVVPDTIVPLDLMQTVEDAIEDFKASHPSRQRDQA